MTLEITSLRNALQSLKIALEEFDKTHSVFVKDACIQRFEYTYELSCKMLKRQLEGMSANPDEYDKMSFQDLIREGSEKSLLLNGWDKWAIYRKKRGTTSHGYDAEKANEVFAIIPYFYEDAKYLLEQLEKHNER